ncbi:hypothetical protein [Paracoccus shanxieyensis]|uniref:Uncharacterized protein n=1 Tax=Paracoccus shanxieyensis TaxID=2675752 RepID=A0A6L6IW50_9RHOB|nr:hypothetical protein [Paracoccus shanxieyensis]MTH64726.1 hypothetical protein [Paracoccus shanxieyensis]MTH87870.1 hypothetical protein [Paracoccus shanxieyensis]
MTQDATDNHMSMAVRNSNGTFARGPGRVKGSKNRLTRESVEKLHELAPAAWAALINNLAAGEQRAVEFVLNRLLPAGRVLEVDATPDGIRDHLEHGDFSTDEARAIASVLEKLESLEKISVLEQRVEQLTALLQGGAI